MERRERIERRRRRAYLKRFARWQARYNRVLEKDWSRRWLDRSIRTLLYECGMREIGPRPTASP